MFALVQFYVMPFNLKFNFKKYIDLVSEPGLRRVKTLVSALLNKALKIPEYYQLTVYKWYHLEHEHPWIINILFLRHWIDLLVCNGELFNGHILLI